MKQFEQAYPTSYDVIVAGGGPAGIAAAVSAARLGAKTALIERYGLLGGMLLVEGQIAGFSLGEVIGDLAPEGGGVTDELHVGVLFQHPLDPGQTQLVHDAVGVPMLGGDVDENGKPVSMDKGKSYTRWVRNVKKYGYNFEYRILNAALAVGVASHTHPPASPYRGTRDLEIDASGYL